MERYNRKYYPNVEQRAPTGITIPRLNAMYSRSTVPLWTQEPQQEELPYCGLESSNRKYCPSVEWSSVEWRAPTVLSNGGR
ncbi:hypothetical protein XELAEV_18034360mg [Xenopus laevis]|uniref:Uncharacterized protein n=1 Tax=Xenopus laevis TaxID=8355 RepID=A0A974CDV4_XENLA|nr:hypothetical protein XELAEV_18034360mg [Xenopus laevis]